MDVHMSAAELALFKSFLACSERYLEFGAGGSTQLAVSMGKRVISIDSSDEWLAKVETECSALKAALPPLLAKVDIGPTGDWGTPVDPTTRERWPSYYHTAWTVAGSAESDLYLIDGRFRVACFASVVLHCRPSAIILIHDFFSRPYYHVVKEIGREIARCEDISAFQLLSDITVDKVKAILQTHAYDPH